MTPLEQAATDYANTAPLALSMGMIQGRAFVAGAEWMREKITDTLQSCFDRCGDVTEGEFNRIMDTI